MAASVARGGWPVVAREAELAAVTSFLRAPLRSSAALVIEGEAGIGKSTIVRAALERASTAGRVVLAARLSVAESALPYAALGDLLAAFDDDALSALARPQRMAIAVALGKTSGTVESHALSRGLLELLRARAAGGDLLLVFDDVQWLDRPTASAAAFALRRLGASRLRVLLALRTGRRCPRSSSASPIGRACDGSQSGRCPQRSSEHCLRRITASGYRGLAWRRLMGPPAATRCSPSSSAGQVAETGRPVPRSPAGVGAAGRARRGVRAALTFAAVALRPSTDLLLGAGVDRDDLRAALESEVLRVEVNA